MRVRFRFDKAVYGATEDSVEKLGPRWAQRIFELFIEQVCSNVYPRGLKQEKARAWNRILCILDQSDDGAEFINLDLGDIEILKSILFHDEATAQRGQTRLLCAVQDEIEAALIRSRQEESAN